MSADNTPLELMEGYVINVKDYWRVRMKRISDEKLNELIDNEGELSSGAISIMGVLRLALDLRDARATKEIPDQLYICPVCKDRILKPGCCHNPYCHDRQYIYPPKYGICHKCGEVTIFCKCEK